MKLSLLVTFIIICRIAYLNANEKIIVANKEISLDLENSDKLHSGIKRYEQIKKASKILKPEEILKVAITYTFDDFLVKKSAPPLPAVKYDRASFERIASYIKDFVYIDDSPANRYMGGRHEVIKKIDEKLKGKNAALFFFSGHSAKTGYLPIPTYTKECRELYSKLEAEYRKSFSQKQIDDGEVSIRHESPQWINSDCRIEDYYIAPDDFSNVIFRNMTFALILDTCSSGVYNFFTNHSMLQGDVFAAAGTEHSHSYDTIDHKGGVLIVELKRRFEKDIGCQLDGQGGGTKDLVLDLREWTYNLGKEKKMNLNNREEIASQTMGSNVQTKDDALKTLPIHVYTGEECGVQQNIDQQNWEMISKKNQMNFKTIEDLKRFISIEDSMKKLSGGETYLEESN